MIRITPIRVIGPDNEQYGVIETPDALRKAQELGLDLVEISPEARPPVCKIMDYGKYKYELSQKERKNRAASKATELKEIRLGRSVKIDPHDIQVRIDQARRFMMAGHKVLFIQRLKGREVAHRELGEFNLKKVLDSLVDIAKIEQGIRYMGKAWTMMLSPDKPKVDAIKRKLEKERQEKLAKGEKVEDEKTIEQVEAEVAAMNKGDEGDDGED